MRRSVRYKIMGEPRPIALQLAEQTKQCELVDVSQTGFGVQTDSIAGFEIGQQVIVASTEGDQEAVIVRIDAAEPGRFHLGLQKRPMRMALVGARSEGETR